MSGVFQDGGNDVISFVTTISASLGQNVHFSTHRSEDQQKYK